MFSRRSDEKSKKDRSNRNLAQYGLFDVPSTLSFDDSEAIEDNDSDLEEELLALTLSGPSKPPRKAKTSKVAPVVNIDALVQDSMRDIPSDEDISDGEDNDIHLLQELKELTQNEAEAEAQADAEAEKEAEAAAQIPEQKAETSMEQLLDDRLKMYMTAEENAKKAGEISRARRFSRGIKTLQGLIKEYNAGKAINPEDIPPEVAVTMSQKTSGPPEPHPVVTFKSAEDIVYLPPASASESSAESGESFVRSEMKNNELLGLLSLRRDQYKIAALDQKRAGNIPVAKEYLRTVKQFEAVIKAVENGEEVDLSSMPGAPNDLINHITINEPRGKTESETQQNTENVMGDEEEEQEEQLITASSILEALEQRLGVYKSQENAAKSEGNLGKIRRMGRIVKQFEQAIKLHKNGKPIPLDDLPTPPGYAPIILNPPPAASPAAPSSAPSAAPSGAAATNLPEISSSQISLPSISDPSNPTSSKVVPNVNPTRKMGNQQSNTRIDKQVALLLARQKEFKEAALAAKRKGEIAQAKELLRTAKGFDKVIDAARGGFPIDMESLPIPANSRSILDESFEVVLAEECKEDDTGTLEILSRLEEQLTKQLKMCLSTRDHHKALGDVAGMNRFENLALAVTRDLDIVRLSHRTCGDVPKYHYENKSFSIVKCCTDLNDNDLEVAIVRGINFNVTNPKEIDTYVKFEFPYPQDDPFKERTTVVKDTNNPEYNTTYTIPIQRTSRQCLRVFKRQSLKLEVYSRGGFFRSDQLIGTVQIKLQPLETHCEIHDSYDLMDGRKKNGGKLEVKIRVRHPMVANQVEQLNEKWLVLNH